jgi:hypothetical protein
MKICRDCKKEIPIDAKKCFQCGAYQNWMRYFNQSLLIAGFLLTWLSIWAAPPIVKMLDSQRADINVSILEGDHTQITFMIANSGSQPAGLSQIEIESKTTSDLYSSWYLKTKLDKSLLEPGKAYIVEANNGSTVPAAVSHEIQSAMSHMHDIEMDKNCRLVVQYVQMSGTKEYLYHPFSCDVELMLRKLKNITKKTQPTKKRAADF